MSFTIPTWTTADSWGQLTGLAGAAGFVDAPGRWLIVAAALGSGVAFLDGSVVNVARRQTAILEPPEHQHHQDVRTVILERLARHPASGGVRILTADLALGC